MIRMPFAMLLGDPGEYRTEMNVLDIKIRPQRTGEVRSVIQEILFIVPLAPVGWAVGKKTAPRCRISVVITGKIHFSSKAILAKVVLAQNIHCLFLSQAKGRHHYR